MMYALDSPTSGKTLSVPCVGPVSLVSPSEHEMNSLEWKSHIPHRQPALERSEKTGLTEQVGLECTMVKKHKNKPG